MKPKSLPFSGFKTQPPKKRKNHHPCTCFFGAILSKRLPIFKELDQKDSTEVPLTLHRRPQCTSASFHACFRGCIKIPSSRCSLLSSQIFKPSPCQLITKQLLGLGRKPKEPGPRTPRARLNAKTLKMLQSLIRALLCFRPLSTLPWG